MFSDSAMNRLHCDNIILLFFQQLRSYSSLSTDVTKQQKNMTALPTIQQQTAAMMVNSRKKKL